ncbi:MAG: hypothetical protein IJC88_00255 [Oscillospiraceae bacterium]|nr:hypothetical protein [Oscillospiraceae bacterium]
MAWFTDTSNEVRNIFHIAEFDLVVSHRLEDGTFEELDGTQKIFEDEALYEPGYTQVVFLKVENRGTIPFDFKAAVNITDYTPAINVFGRSFNLQDHLTFGVLIADTEAELDAKLANRSLAAAIANMPLNNYSTNVASIDAGGEQYIALIVRMPEEVGNEANYRGSVQPRVELGLICNATQQH